MIKRFFAYYAPWRGLFLLDFGCALLSGLLELGFPMAVRGFVDHLLPTQSWGLILAASAALLLAYIANTALNGIVVYWGHMLGINIETEMRRRSFDHLQKLSFRFYDNNKTGHLVARVTKDLEEIGEVAHHGPEDLFIAIMTFLGAFALMLTVNTTLALITALIVPATVFLATRYGTRMTWNFRALFSRVAQFNVRVEENVGGMRVVQAFANEDHERARFAEDNARYRSTKLQAYRLMAASSSLNYLSMRLTQLVVMLAGSYLVLHGSLSNGDFVGFLLLVGVFFRPVEKINNVLESYPKGIAGFRRYTELLDTAPDIVDRPQARAVAGLRGDIAYDGVSFGYTADRPVLTDVNLSIAAGESVAFVGPTGAGKSTLAKLANRFYDPTSGRVLVDGIDISTVTLHSLRSQIGVVPQEPFLFAGSLRSNVRFSRPSATDEEVNEAIAVVGLDDLVARLPEGLDTVVHERGQTLSAGERQLLALARAFVARPRVLILDEATSSLDLQSETCLLYTSPSPRDRQKSRMPSSA